MNVLQTKFTLKGLPPRKSVLIEGDHGKGKSQVVRQTVQELSQETGKVHQFVDIRLAQREVGDIIGMPRSQDSFEVTITAFKDGQAFGDTKTYHNVTTHDLPLWFPQDMDSYGYLFLDEFHYATKDVQQAVMELALDYTLNMHPLPQGWRVIAAGNHNQDVYGGTTINPALYDRFLKIEFKPTSKEWLDWAKLKTATPYGPVNRAVTSYINKIPTDLDPPEGLEPGKIAPSRRSWVTLSEVCYFMKEERNFNPFKDLDYLTLLAKGYLGETVAINFVEYVRKEYTIYSVEEIIDGWEKDKEMQRNFKKYAPAEVAFYTSEIVTHFEKTSKNPTKKQCANLLEFIKTIAPESATGFWIHFAKTARAPAMVFYDFPGVGEFLSDSLEAVEGVNGGK